MLRIEDIDRQRSHAEYIEGIKEDLAWMDLSYDEGPDGSYSYGTPVQSLRFPLYQKIMDRWKEAGEVYPCFCSRARLHSIASAPHEGEGLPVYDGHCRCMSAEEVADREKGKAPSWRLRMEESCVSFRDLFCGEETCVLRPGIDDFVLRRADGMVAYQLAVSVDDAAMGMTHVFRGNDLLSSTFYQLYLLKNWESPMFRLTDICLFSLMRRESGSRSGRKVSLFVK